MLSDQNTHADPLATFDWTDGDTVSSAIIVALSELTGEPPENLDPLFDAVDPDCLDGLFAPTRNSQARIIGGVEFEYNGYWIVVRANGRGYVHDLDADLRSDLTSSRDGRTEE
jgi:hypothetical protein